MLSRKESRQQARSVHAKDKQGTALPSRKRVHDSAKAKRMQYFYTSLVIVFVALTIGLFVWGIKQA